MLPNDFLRKLQDILRFVNQTINTEPRNYENIGNTTIILGNLQYLANPGPNSDKTIYPIMALLIQYGVNISFLNKIPRHGPICKTKNKLKALKKRKY